MRKTTRPAWIFAFLILLASSAPAQPAQSRTDHLLFSMPAGWKRIDKEQLVVLTPTDLPAGKMVEIRIAPMRPLAGSLEGNAQQEIASINKKYAAVQSLPLTKVKHPNGFDVVISGASMATAPGANVFLYSTFYFTRAGEQVQPIYFVTNDQPLYMSMRPVIAPFIDSIRLTDLIVLADGNPPLTQAKLDQVTDFLEWLMDVPFTEDQRQTITRFAVESWKKNDRAEIDGVEDMLKIRTQLAAMSKEQKAVARRQAQDAAIKEWRTQSDSVAKLMVQIHDAAHQPIAQGDPPLTRQASDALLEVLFFEACHVNSQPEVMPTQQMKDEWAKNLAANYANIDAAARQQIAQMPGVCAAMRSQWAQLPEEQKTILALQWSRSPEVSQIAVALINASLPQAPAGQPGEKSAAEMSNDVQKQYATYNALSNASMNLYHAQMSAISSVGSAGGTMNTALREETTDAPAANPRRRRLVRVARILVVVWLGCGLVLYALQDYLLFPGRATQGQKQAVIRESPSPDRYELVRLATRSNERIVALFGRAMDADGHVLGESESRTHPTVLFFYGNGMCLADTFGEFFRFRKLGVNVIIPEYVGYGMSTGKPNETALYETADAAYDHLQSRGDVDPKQIIAAGWSLGAAVAIDLANRRPVIGLATFSAFTSYADMGRAMLPWFPAPVSMIARYKFASIEKVKTIEVPIFIAHGSHDRIIPNRMSDQLSKAATRSSRVTTVRVATDHNDIFEAQDALWTPFENWLNSLTPYPNPLPAIGERE